MHIDTEQENQKMEECRWHRIREMEKELRKLFVQ